MLEHSTERSHGGSDLETIGNDLASSAQSKCAVGSGDSVHDSCSVASHGNCGSSTETSSGCATGSGSSSISLCRRAECEPWSSGSGSMASNFDGHGCLSSGGAVCDVAVLPLGLHIVWVLVSMMVGLVKVI